MHEDELIGDRYRLSARINAGDLGEIWRAVDIRLDRTVAVKLLHAEVSASEEFRARFESEARTLAGLDAPSVAAVSDHGIDESADGVRCYLVMELVDGRSLATVLGEHGALAPGEVARIVAEAAEGLQAAHDAGIVHGGIRPADVLLTAGGDVKLIDFGTARAVDPAAADYTAPERFADAEPTPTADIYALGAVAFECLSGRPPFASDDAEAVAHGHLNQPPPALPDDIPETLAEAVYRALRKEPADRWLTVHSFGAACRTVATAKPQAEPTVPVADTVEEPEVPAVVAAPIPEPEPEAAEDAPADEPPSDEPAPARRRRALVPLLAVLAVLIALAAIFVVPRLSGDDDPGTAGSAESSSAVDDAASSPGGEPSEEDEPSGAPGSADDQPGGPGTTGSGSGTTTGPALVAVPDLVGKQASEAPDLLRDKGFEKHQPEVERSGDFTAACEIWEQTPAAGERVAPDTTIVYRYEPGIFGSDCSA